MKTILALCFAVAGFAAVGAPTASAATVVVERSHHHRYHHVYHRPYHRHHHTAVVIHER